MTLAAVRENTGTLGMDAAERIRQSLHRLAERDIDIVPEVYRRFFAACPAAEPLFANTAAGSVQGKMLNEVLQSLLDLQTGCRYIETLLQTQRNDHDSWGVTAAMYPLFLAALCDTVIVHLDAADADTRQAWQQACLALLKRLNPETNGLSPGFSFPG